MKHVVIFSHPNEASFIAALSGAYMQAAEALGHAVVVRDLYRMKFDPCLKSGELPFSEKFAPAADVVEERALLEDADVFALLYPLWLNAPPAMMKGYLERVFGYGFAYGKSGRSEPLLGNRKLFTVSSSGAPLHWVKETGAFGAITALFDRYFAELCGMTFVEHLHFGGIVPGIRDDAVASRLAEVQEAVRKQFGRLQ